MPDGRFLLWSDIPHERVMRWDENDGVVSSFMQPAMNQNGHTLERQGRLLCCEHRVRSVSRIAYDGRRHVLAHRFEGTRLNKPNDVVVKCDDVVALRGTRLLGHET